MTDAPKNSIVRLSDHEESGRCIEVPLDSLVPYEHHVRTSFNEKSLQQLADSIKQLGITPLTVRPKGGGKYEVIDGERRRRAARLAGVEVVSVYVLPLDDASAYEVNFSANRLREDWAAFELAPHVLEAVRKAGGKLVEVAAEFNRSKSWVCKLAAIAAAGEIVNQLIDEGVTYDSAVLATVASLERRLPFQAKRLGKMLRQAPQKSNKRAIAEQFMQQVRVAEQSAVPCGVWPRD